jgi:acetoin utilization deacetylase AcuC-like enzyme
MVGFSMRVVSSPRHRLHAVQHDVQAGVAVRHWEQPARVERILEALGQDGAFRVEPPTEHGLAPIQAVHARGLIDYLAEAWQDWQGAQEAPPAAEMFPDTIIHPALREGMDVQAREPRSPIGRLGYWVFDTGTPIVAGTYAAARAAVDVALSAADLLLAGETCVYGLCRPPGHHAARSVCGGFCYLNNAAITADYLARHTGERVAILDVDYHHGNGTQQIFYDRSDVLYVSLHGDPVRAYPYFLGHADETGSGPGQGTTFNIPLPAGTTDAQYLTALDRALEALTAFAPFTTVVSLGMDTYGQDPLGDFGLTTAVYYTCGRRIAAATGRLVIVQEGGYYLPDLGDNVRQWLRGAANED